MTKVLSEAYSIASEYQRIVANIMIAACLVALLIYGINLYGLISKTVARQEVEAQVATVADSIKSLDAKYISLTSNINPEMGKNFGLHEISVSDYINRLTTLGRVAIRNSGI